MLFLEQLLVVHSVTASLWEGSCIFNLACFVLGIDFVTSKIKPEYLGVLCANATIQ